MKKVYILVFLLLTTFTYAANTTFTAQRTDAAGSPNNDPVNASFRIYNTTGLLIMLNRTWLPDNNGRFFISVDMGNYTNNDTLNWTWQIQGEAETAGVYIGYTPYAIEANRLQGHDASYFTSTAAFDNGTIVRNYTLDNGSIIRVYNTTWAFNSVNNTNITFQNVNISNNLTVSNTGFFTKVGAWWNRVSEGWFDFLDFNRGNATNMTAITYWKGTNVVNSTVELMTVFTQNASIKDYMNATYLNLSGGNANQNINISPYNLTTGTLFADYLGSPADYIDGLWVHNISSDGEFETTCLHCEGNDTYFHGNGIFEGNVTAPNIEVMESLIVHGNASCTGTALNCNDVMFAGSPLLCGLTIYTGQRGCRWQWSTGTCVGTATSCSDMSTTTCEEQHACTLSASVGFIFGEDGFTGNITFHDNVDIGGNLNVSGNVTSALYCDALRCYNLSSFELNDTYQYNLIKGINNLSNGSIVGLVNTSISGSYVKITGDNMTGNLYTENLYPTTDAVYNLGFLGTVVSLNGLMHYYLNGDVTDASPNNFDAVANAVTYDTGKINQGASFDGATSYVDCGDANESLTNLSVFAWVNMTVADTGAVVTHVQRTPEKRAWALYLGGTLFSVSISGDGDTSGQYKEYATNDGIDYSDGTWHQIGFTWNNGVLKLYADGAEVTSLTISADDSFTTIYNTPADIVIGARQNGASYDDSYNGKVDDVRVYNFTLSQSQITFIYNYGTGTESEAGTSYDLKYKNLYASNSVSDGTNTMTLSNPMTFNVPILSSNLKTSASYRSIAVGNNTGNVEINNVTYLGDNSGVGNTGQNAIFAGSFSGRGNTGVRALGIGIQSLENNIGNDVICLGFQCGLANTVDNQFIIQQRNLALTPLLQGDLLKGRLGVNKTTPLFTLDLGGEATMNASYYYGNGTYLKGVCLANGTHCQSSGGSSSFPNQWLNTSTQNYINRSYPQDIWFNGTFNITGTVCGGVAADCADFTWTPDPEVDCPAQIGCVWDGMDCTGTHNPCSSYSLAVCPTQDDCALGEDSIFILNKYGEINKSKKIVTNKLIVDTPSAVSGISFIGVPMDGAAPDAGGIDIGIWHNNIGNRQFAIFPSDAPSDSTYGVFRYWFYLIDGFYYPIVDGTDGGGSANRNILQTPASSTIFGNQFDYGDDGTDASVQIDDSASINSIALSVNGKSRFVGDMNITGDAYIKGDLNVTGNVSFKRPYGMYSSNQTQVLLATSTAYPVNFTVTEDSYLIQIDSTRKENFTFLQSGDYLIELSAIFSTSVANKDAEIWVQKTNSSNQMVSIPRSNTKVEIAGTGEQVVSVPFILDMHLGDKFRVMWAGESTGVKMIYTGATTYSPETPSIIMTISKISEITP